MTQKVAAQTLPVVGALGGAAVNYAFIEHFQEVAQVILPFVGSNESTAKTLCVLNTSSLLRNTETQLIPANSGVVSLAAKRMNGTLFISRT